MAYSTGKDHHEPVLLIICNRPYAHLFGRETNDVSRFTDSVAEVVEWQTRTFEGRVAQAVRVQVPPSAPSLL